MKNFLLIVMLVSTPAAAQEFATDMPAMGEILAQARAYKVKHDGRPAPRRIGVYIPGPLRVEFRSDERSLRLLYGEAPLVEIKLSEAEWKDATGETLAASLEAMCARAVKEKSYVEIDYDVIAHHAETGVWTRPFMRVQGDARITAL